MKTLSLFAAIGLSLISISQSAQAHHHGHHDHYRYSQPVLEHHHHRHHRHHETNYYEPVYRQNWVAPVGARVIISTPVVSLPVIPAPRYHNQDPRYISYPVPAEPPGHHLYCRYPDGFYPAIRHCPGGWQRLPHHR